MTLTLITVTDAVDGEIILADRCVLVRLAPATYEVADIDPGEALGLTQGEGVVWVQAAALALVTCLACDGRGEHRYRVAIDEVETEGCEECDGYGLVTVARATEQEAELEEQRAAQASW